MGQKWFFPENYGEGRLWEEECRSIPFEVTDILEQIGKKYEYTPTRMHENKMQIIQELTNSGFSQIVTFLFPKGYDSNDYQKNIVWHYALSAMRIRWQFDRNNKSKSNWSLPTT